MSGIRRGKNNRMNNNNNQSNSNGNHDHDHHHHHRGLTSMPSKQEMANLPVLDLHGCFKQDAKRKVTDFLEQQAARNSSNTISSGLLLCKIVTGTGAHSSATGGPILRTAVENLLNRRQMHYDAKSCPGAFIVDAGTGIVFENRACTSQDTKILVAHAEDEAVILQRAAQQQGKRRAAACTARSNNHGSLHSSSSSLNNSTSTLGLLSGPSIHEVAAADKALEWAQVESRKAYQEHSQITKRDSKLVEKAISLSLRDDSSFSNHHDDDDHDTTWQEELETALKISQQETTSAENAHEKIKLALQESARLEEERREMEEREMQELEMVLRLSQQQQQHEEETTKDLLMVVDDDEEDLELERALLESVRLQELETTLRRQAEVEVQEPAAHQRQVELETLATIERQRQLEQQIALDRQQEVKKQALALEQEWQRQELERQLEVEKQAALERERELEQQVAAHREKQDASALRIQATVRGYQCRLMTCEMRTRIMAAIVLIQTHWRRRLAFLRYQQHRRRTASATLIQSVARSYQCRRLMLVSQEAEKEAARQRQQEEDEDEKLAMALQQEENEEMVSALQQHLCTEAEQMRDEDLKQLRSALGLSQHEAGEPRSGGLGWQEDVLCKSGCQKAVNDREMQSACMQQPYNLLKENGCPGTQAGAEEVEENNGKQAPSELKDSRGQRKRAPSSPPQRECFKTEQEEEHESIYQNGGPPSGTAKLPPATIAKQQKSNLKPPPAPGPKSPGGRLERAPGEQGKSPNRDAAMNALKQSPGEATRQGDTVGRAEQALLVQESVPSGYAMQFPERRESAKSKKDTKALDQAILEASRSKQANLLADFLSRSF